MLLFTTCKKGEDDPFISFRSRKARVEGKWRLEKGHVTLTTVDYANAARLNQIFDMSSSTVTLTETSASLLPNVYRGAYIISLDCTKTGEFNLYELLGTKVFEVSGSWVFNSRSAGKRNKEYITMKIQKTIQGRTSGGSLFNQNSVDFTYRIKELRDKKMVLTVESDIYVDAGSGLEQTYEGEYTFIQ